MIMDEDDYIERPGVDRQAIDSVSSIMIFTNEHRAVRTRGPERLTLMCTRVQRQVRREVPWGGRCPSKINYTTVNVLWRLENFSRCYETWLMNVFTEVWDGVVCLSR
jgi:hypothetical protein